MSNYYDTVLKSFFADAWRWKCGMKEKDEYVSRTTFESLKQTEWSSEFWRYVESAVYDMHPNGKPCTEKFKTFANSMKKHLIMGALRYGGRIGEAGKPSYDRVGAMKRYYGDFLETGNAERLVDFANYCMLEYVEGGDGRISEPTQKYFYDNVSQFFATAHASMINQLTSVSIEFYEKDFNTTRLINLCAMAYLRYEYELHDDFHYDSICESDLHCETK